MSFTTNFAPFKPKTRLQGCEPILTLWSQLTYPLRNFNKHCCHVVIFCLLLLRKNVRNKPPPPPLNPFFSLWHTFNFETRPSPLSNIKENAFGAHFLQLYRKNEYDDPHFLLFFYKDSASFRWEKNWYKSMISFLAILLNCTDSVITCQIARV